MRSDNSILIEKVSQSSGTILSTEARFTIGLEELPNHLQSIISDNMPTRSPDQILSIHGNHFIDWLRKILFPSLPVNMHVFTVSLFPFNEIGPQEEVWEKKVKQLELQPLDQIASFHFIKSYDIHDFETCHYLAKTAKGMPLALHKLCEDTRQEGIDYVSGRNTIKGISIITYHIISSKE